MQPHADQSLPDAPLQSAAGSHRYPRRGATRPIPEALVDRIDNERRGEPSAADVRHDLGAGRSGAGAADRAVCRRSEGRRKTCPYGAGVQRGHGVTQVRDTCLVNETGQHTEGAGCGHAAAAGRAMNLSARRTLALAAPAQVSPRAQAGADDRGPDGGRADTCMHLHCAARSAVQVSNRPTSRGRSPIDRDPPAAGRGGWNKAWHGLGILGLDRLPCNMRHRPGICTV